MSILRLPVAGLDLQTKLSITQTLIAAGAGATFSNANAANVGAGGVCTFTTNGAHGLTLNPSAGVPPNYFVTFGGSSSAITGTGVLINNVFRILSIPSTTTFTFWSTISTATVTSTTVVPVFYPNFLAGNNSAFAGGPTQTISTVVTGFPPPQLEAAMVFCITGANCTVQIDQGQTSLLLDPQSTPTTGTPATAPTWTAFTAVSTNDMNFLCAPWGAVWASTANAGTTTLSVVN